MTRPRPSLLLATLVSVMIAPVARAQTVPPIPSELQLAPAEGVRVIRPSAPTWCGSDFDALPANQTSESRLRDLINLRRIAEGSNTSFNLARSLGDLNKIARLGCTHPSDANARAWLTAYRQLIINETDMPDEAVAALMRLALHASDRRAQLDCEGYAQDGQMPAPERAERTAIAMFVCGSRGVQADQVLYWLDQSETMSSELLRAAVVFVAGHMEASAFGKPIGTQGIAPNELSRGNQLANWINVRRDALQLDPSRLQRDLTSSRLNETERVFARVQFHRVRRIGAVLDRAWRAKARSVPGLEPIVTSVPEEAFGTWVREYAAHRSDIDAAYAFERQLATAGPGAVSGCATDLRRRFLQFARTQTANVVEDVQALVDGPVGSVLAAALYRCELSSGENIHAMGLFEVLQNSNVQRGPRTAALNAARRAVAMAAQANPRFPFRARDLTPFANMADNVHWLDGVGDAWAESAEGIVSSVRTEGDRVEIAFERTSREVATYRCTETDRIHRIRADGTIQYRTHCVTTGTRTLDTTPEPIRVHRDFAEGIRVGVTLRAFVAPGSGPRAALPAQVYRDGRGERLAAYLGVPLTGERGSAGSRPAASGVSGGERGQPASRSERRARRSRR